MKIKLMTVAILGAAGIVAWFALGKPTTLAEVQAKISQFIPIHPSKANFGGGWVGAVGNPGFVHGWDHPGYPGVGYGHPQFGYHPDFNRFHGGYGGISSRFGGHPYYDGFHGGGFGGGYRRPFYPQHHHEEHHEGFIPELLEGIGL
jgi:hypothetical protein